MALRVRLSLSQAKPTSSYTPIERNSHKAYAYQEALGGGPPYLAPTSALSLAPPGCRVSLRIGQLKQANTRRPGSPCERPRALSAQHDAAMDAARVGHDGRRLPSPRNPRRHVRQAPAPKRPPVGSLPAHAPQAARARGRLAPVWPPAPKTPVEAHVGGGRSHRGGVGRGGPRPTSAAARRCYV